MTKTQLETELLEVFKAKDAEVFRVDVKISQIKRDRVRVQVNAYTKRDNIAYKVLGRMECKPEDVFQHAAGMTHLVSSRSMSRAETVVPESGKTVFAEKNSRLLMKTPGGRVYDAPLNMDEVENGHKVIGLVQMSAAESNRRKNDGRRSTPKKESIREKGTLPSWEKAQRMDKLEKQKLIYLVLRNDAGKTRSEAWEILKSVGLA